MAAKGYTTKAKVATFLGATFTAGQDTYCDVLIEKAEIAIDNHCNRAWLTGVQTNETHWCPGYSLYVKYPPVTSVASVAGRSGLGETEETLTVDEDYEVRDLTSGLIHLVYPGSYDRVRVTYTPVATVPGPVEQATTELVAQWMQAHLRPDTYGLDSYTLPDLAVKFARSHVQEAVPPTVSWLLDDYVFPAHG
jgi:hypothetical protein